ncbi:MAG: alpha/beta hydrolase [Candidatus Omnitrophota bacterium]
MKNNIFIFVHGAYSGAWCWDKVLSILDSRNNAFYAPDLSGLGERKKLLSPFINLSTHINDVVQVVTEEGLEDVTLVGHSYAGMVISGAAEVMPHRIEQLIYLDSMLPQDGQSAFDIMPGTRARLNEINYMGEAVKVIMPPDPRVLGIDGPQEAERVKSLMVPMPAACYEEKIRLKSPMIKSIKKTYILCETQAPGDSQKSHESAYERAAGDSWSRIKIPGAHMVMLTHPKELSEILLQLAVGRLI